MRPGPAGPRSRLVRRRRMASRCRAPSPVHGDATRERCHHCLLSLGGIHQDPRRPGREARCALRDDSKIGSVVRNSKRRPPEGWAGEVADARSRAASARSGLTHSIGASVSSGQSCKTLPPRYLPRGSPFAPLLEVETAPVPGGVNVEPAEVSGRDRWRGESSGRRRDPAGASPGSPGYVRAQ